MDTNQISNMHKQATQAMWHSMFSSLLTWLLILAGILLVLAFIQSSQRKRVLISPIRPVFDHAKILRYILGMSWSQFEVLCRQLFERQGFTITLTRPLGTNEVELIGSKDGQKLLAWCTRTFGATVSAPQIEQFGTTMSSEEAITGYFVTTGEFSQPAIDCARGEAIALIDGNRLAAWAAEYSDTAPGPQPSPPAEPKVANAWEQQRQFEDAKHYICAGCGEFVTLASEPAEGEPVCCAKCHG